MSTKETMITTETAADGTEMVSEISSVISETAADGTETVAEITTTAGDEPGEVEGHITLTETAPDGTETVTEITTNADGSVIVEEDKSLTEEVYEAVFGEEGEDYETDEAASPVEGSATGKIEVIEVSSEFEAAGGTLDPDAAPADFGEAVDMSTPVEPAFGIADPAYSATATTDSAADAAVAVGALPQRPAVRPSGPRDRRRGCVFRTAWRLPARRDLKAAPVRRWVRSKPPAATIAERGRRGREPQPLPASQTIFCDARNSAIFVPPSPSSLTI